MTITKTGNHITITLGAHTKRSVREATKKATELWSNGQWVEVSTMLGDPIFWITPSGAKFHDEA